MHRWTVFIVGIMTFVMGARSSSDTTRPVAPTLRLPFPSAADSARNLSALRTRLDAVFARGIGNGAVSAKVVSLRTGNVLYERNASRALTPASTTKLFTTVAAFHLMGKGATVNTVVRTDGLIDRTGTLDGNLYVVGHGDALLSVRDLEDMADALTRQGIKRIKGNIYGDATNFGDATDRATYSGDFETVQAMPPVQALTVQQSTVAVLVTGTAAGRVSVQTIPASDAFVIVTSGTAAPAPKGRRARRARGGRVRVSSTTLADGRQQFVVAGSPGVNRTVTQYITMTRPAMATAGAFASRLRAGGIDIDGTVSERRAPVSSNILTVFRRPLSDFAAIVNKRSDNHLAEHVFKMVGSVCGEHKQTAQRAKKAVMDVLDSLGVPNDVCSFNDGSGLSRRNKASADAEVALLVEASREPWFPEFRSTLAVAGIDGTIRRRMTGTRAVGNVLAKTGTLRNVSALAGYVNTVDGELLAFAFIENGPSVGSYKAAENAAAVALSAFSYALPPSTTEVSPVISPAPVAKKKIVPTKTSPKKKISAKKSVPKKKSTKKRTRRRR